MKSPLLVLGLLILGLGAYLVLKTEPTAPPERPDPLAATRASPPALDSGSASWPADSPTVFSVENPIRPPAEAAAPFDTPEAERTCPSPFTLGISIDTPLVACGQTIPLIEIQRHLCLGFGYAYSEVEKFQIIIDQELERRKAAGEDLSRYVASDADLEKVIEKQRLEFAERYPTLDFKTEVGRAFIAYDLYREPSRQSIVFGRLFLPENPREWPEVSRELIRAYADGTDALLVDAEQSYDRRKQKMIDDGLEELPADDPVIEQVWKDTVLSGLSDFSQIETQPDRLPPGVLMSVDGREVTIETVWRKIEPYVTPMDVDEVRRFLALCKLMENELAAQGTLMSQEEFEQVWPKLVAPNLKLTYRQTLNNHQMVAVQMLGMPSVQAYAYQARLIESLRKARAAELSDMSGLSSYVTACNQITGIGKVQLEAILCSAWDGDRVTWKADGWADARRRAHELKAQLDAGADWQATRELHSEFWDPPMPAVGQKPQYGFRFKGAFGEQTRNQLLGMMEETETTNLIYGRSVTDRVFFEQRPGTIEGPFLGPRGFYIVRLTGRQPPMQPLDLNVPSHRKLVEDFYLKMQFNQRAHELLRQGLADGSARGI